jgi:hypothetical protein
MAAREKGQARKEREGAIHPHRRLGSHAPHRGGRNEDEVRHVPGLESHAVKGREKAPGVKDSRTSQPLDVVAQGLDPFHQDAILALVNDLGDRSGILLLL